jgi:hypothetical protein
MLGKMKTVFDKIDPEFLECSTGHCQHAIHAGNGFLWAFVFVLSLVFLSFHIRICKD